MNPQPDRAARSSHPRGTTAAASALVVERLFLSPGHNFFGHHGGPAGSAPTVEVDTLECVAGRGVRGDRFFDYAPDYKGQITFFSREVLENLRRELRLPGAQPEAARRNVLVSGVDLAGLAGVEFTVQGIQFLGTEECRPCYWMEGALGPGAHAWLRSRGGLRAKILTDGWLRPTSRLHPDIPPD
jgi:MOSC domain-containing protein YiiM